MYIWTYVRSYVCLYVCIYVHVCLYVCVYERMFYYVCMGLCRYVYISMSVYICRCIYNCMYVYVIIHVYTYIFVCVCVCVCAFLMKKSLQPPLSLSGLPSSTLSPSSLYLHAYLVIQEDRWSEVLRKDYLRRWLADVTVICFLFVCDNIKCKVRYRHILKLF